MAALERDLRMGTDTEILDRSGTTAGTTGTPPDDDRQCRSPWWWVPTLYIAEGFPYVLVTYSSNAIYKKLGRSNTEITFWLSLIGLIWMVKPLWSPLVEAYWTKRRWVISMQFCVAAMFGLMAVSLQSAFWWPVSLLVFTLMATCGATHDIAADGLYMIGLSQHRQALFAGVRTTFFRFAVVMGQGVLLVVAGMIETKSGPPPVPISVHAGPEAKPALAASFSQSASPFVRFSPAAPRIPAGTSLQLEVVLTRQPASTQAVTFTRRPSSIISAIFPMGADRAVEITQGDRLEFSPGNWNKPQFVILKADKNLNEPVLVTLLAAAPDLNMVYTWCFGGVCLLFLLMSVYDLFALPKPAADRSVVSGPSRAPFATAASSLAVTMFVPFLIITCLYLALHWTLQSSWERWLLRPPLKSEVYGLLSGLLVVVAVWLVYQSAGVRSHSMGLFHRAAQTSRMPFDEIFISFFRKPGILRMIIFLLVFRSGEALLLRMSPLFLIARRSEGGIGLSQAQFGTAHGTVGVLCMIFAGILGGILVAKGGLKRWLLPMCIVLNLPHLAYLYLAYTQPVAFGTVLFCVGLEQLGYGFGYVAYTLYMLEIAGESEHKTAHFALCTGFASMSINIPGMISGALHSALGSYVSFFWIVVLMTIPSIATVFIIPINPEFGKKRKA